MLNKERFSKRLKVRDVTTPRGNWTDKPCYYVTVRDAGRFAMLAGPFCHQRQAAAVVPQIKTVANDYDPKAFWYAFGTAKFCDGHREGSLNKAVDFDRIPHQPRQAVKNPGQYRF